MRVTQRILNILNGVSQRPDALRHPSQAKEQVNGLTTLRGVQKRPPTQHLAELSASTSDEVFRHQIVKSATEKFLAVIQNGTLKVFNALTGAEITVQTPGGVGYLSSPSDYRAVTVGDKTFIVNRDKVVRKGSSVAAAKVYDSIVWVRQADYATTYTVTLQGYTVTYTTPDGTAPTAREAIGTEAVAEAIYDKLNTTQFTHAGFSFELLGSSIYIRRSFGLDYTLQVTDGLADRGLVVVKGSVQSFDDLPYRAKDGMVMEVAGDRGSEFDNYWVEFDDADGVWREVAQPGTPLSLDETTMPHVLTFGGLYVEKAVAAEPSPPAIVDANLTLEGLQTDLRVNWGEVGDGSSPESVTAITPVVGADRFMTSERTGYGGRVGEEVSGTCNLSLNFAIDTSTVDPGVHTIVEAWYRASDSDLWNLLDATSYNPGQNIRQARMVLNGLSVPSTETILAIRVRHSSTVSDQVEPAESRRATLRLNAQDHATAPGIAFELVQERLVSASLTQRFPKGTVFTFDVDGAPAVYTVSNDEDQWSAVGAALATTIEALADVSATWDAGTGVLSVTATAGGEAPEVTLSFAFASGIDRAWLPDYTMVAGEHVGRLVTNSDGSTGTVTENTEHTITVDALAGGAANAFRSGDTLTITSSDADLFTFAPADWAERGAGSLASAPFPSFTDKRIKDLFFTEGRLGFLTESSTVLSQAGDALNVFRRTVRQLLPDDPIDVLAATPDTTSFHTARLFDEGVFLFSGLAQYRLSGEPVMTPTTVRLDKVSAFENSTACPPLPLGDRLLFPTPSRTSWARILAYRLTETGAAADDTSTEVPEYVPKDVIGMAGNAALGLVFVLTETSRDELFVYSFQPAPDGSMVYAGWSTWEFPEATIVGIEMVDDTLQLVVVRDGDKTCLEKIELAVLPESIALYRDRLGYETTVLYDFRYVPSPFRERNENGTPESRGRLQLGRVSALYTSTLDLDAEVTLEGRTTRTHSLINDEPSDGEFTFPVMGNAEDVTLAFFAEGAEGPVVLNGFSWEGRYHIRRRRI